MRLKKQFKSKRNIMKLFKLIPAALALFALASCSTDEIESTQFEKQNVASKGDLRINFDPIEGELGEAVATRAMADRNFRGPQFEDDDLIFVYDEKMHSTDVYHFDAEADKKAFYFAEQFAGDTKLITGEGDNKPAFGVFVGAVERNADDFNSVKKYPKGWVARNVPGTPTCVDVEIPHVMTYKQNGNLYGFDIPAFGVASFNSEEEYIQLDHFRFLTGILRVKLTNAFGNVSFLKLSNTAGKPVSGKLTATLDANNVGASQLEVVDEDYLYYSELYIDLRNVPSTLSYIYIPVVPGLDGDIDGVKLEYTDNRNVDDIVSEFDNAGNPVVWTNTGMEFPGITFVANHAYAGAYGFELENMSPKKVSDLLNQYKESASNINLNITKTFDIDASDPDIDNIIYVPALKEGVNVNITLGETFTTWNKVGAALQIKDLDPENPFKGTITLNVGDVIKAQTAGEASLRVDLVEGKAIYAGEFDNAQNINPVSGHVQIGDGTTTTSGIALSGAGIGDKLKSFTVAENAVFNDAIDCSNATNETEAVIINGEQNADIISGPMAKVITVGATGVLTGNIDLEDTPAATAADKCTVTVDGHMTGDIDASDGTVGGIFVVVNIDGYVDGSIDLEYAVKSTLTMTTECAAATEQVVTGNVQTKGDVVIDLDAEGEAIAGQLTMLGSAKKIDLVQGFVNAIYVDVQNAGQWENRYINLNLNANDEGIAAFKSLKVNNTAENDVKYTESKWDGNLITNPNYLTKYTKYDNARADEEAFLAAPYNGKTDNAIFTASQLASMGAGLNNLRLLNDIDLTGNVADKGKGKWKSITTLMGSFKAFGHKIKNMNLNNAAAYGLFKTTETGAVSVEDLTLENVTLDTKAANVDGIGSVVATSVGTLTVKNVTVTGINFQDTGKKLVNVGGMIGLSTKPVSMDNVKVAGTIDGFAPLGGFIGGANDNVTIAKGDASGIAFKQTYDSGLAMDITYAQIGGFIGNVAASKTVTITDGTAPSTINYDKSAKMYTSNTTVGTGKFYNYQAEQKFIGFSGNKLATYPQMGYSTINGTKYCAEADWTDGATTDKSHNHGTTAYTFLYTWPAH
jgi:hypothetical protein